MPTCFPGQHLPSCTGRFTCTLPMRCPVCGWGGPLKKCLHDYGGSYDGHIQPYPVDLCPDCGAKTCADSEVTPSVAPGSGAVCSTPTDGLRSPSRLQRGLETVGGCLVVTLFWVVVCLVVGTALQGMVWLASKLYPLACALAALGSTLLVVLLLPSAMLKQNRGWCGSWMYYVSYLWGASLWMCATLVLYTLWGIRGMFLGLVLLGVGSVPLACVALLFAGELKKLGGLVLAVILVFALRYFGLWVETKGPAEGAVTEEYR